MWWRLLSALPEAKIRDFLVVNPNITGYVTPGGGAGAGPSWHGRSGVHTHMTNTRITDPEIFERRYPVRCGRAECLPSCATHKAVYSFGSEWRGLLHKISRILLSTAGCTDDVMMCREKDSRAFEVLTLLCVALQVAMRQFKLRPDSGGDGRWRGGDGIIREVGSLLDGSRFWPAHCEVDSRLSMWTSRPGTTLLVAADGSS